MDCSYNVKLLVLLFLDFLLIYDPCIPHSTERSFPESTGSAIQVFSVSSTFLDLFMSLRFIFFRHRPYPSVLAALSLGGNVDLSYETTLVSEYSTRSVPTYGPYSVFRTLSGSMTLSSLSLGKFRSAYRDA